MAGTVLLGIWLCGATFMLARLLVRLHRDRRDQGTAGRVASSERDFPTRGIPVTVSPAAQGPSVDGVLRPRISLPCGIDRLLNDRELAAVLIHEVAHAKRRDNLIGLIYEIALCGLWARLKASAPRRARGVADSLLMTIYGAAVVACVVETIAHTPSCFKVVM